VVEAMAIAQTRIHVDTLERNFIFKITVCPERRYRPQHMFLVVGSSAAGC
jgi:hypothetical protein